MSQTVARLAVELVGNDAQLRKMFEASERRAGSWSASIAGQATKVAGAVSLITAGVTGLSTSISVQAINDAESLSAALDVSVTSLMSWQYAAKTVGIDAGKMGDIMKDVADKVGDYMLTGGGEAQDAIEALGLSVDDLKGKKPDELLRLIFSEISKVADPNLRANMLESFADEAVRLNPLLADMGKELDGLLRQAKDTNFAVSSEDARSVKKLSVAYNHLEGSIEGASHKLATMAGDSLAEPIESLAVALEGAGDFAEYLDEGLLLTASVMAGRATPAVRQWVDANRERLAVGVKQAASDKTAAEFAHKVAKEEAARLATTVKAFDAEHALEQQRMNAQISTKGRIDSAMRSVEIRKAELAVSGQLESANKKLATTQQGLTVAQANYNRVATLGGRATQGLKASVRGLNTAVGFLGGPVGVVILAATAFATYAANIDRAKLSTQKSIGPIDQLALSMRELYDVMAGNREDNLINSLAGGFAKNSLEKLETMIISTAARINGIKDGSIRRTRGDLDDQERRLAAMSIAWKKLKAAQGEGGDGKPVKTELTLHTTADSVSAREEAERRSAEALAALDMRFASEQQQLWLQHAKRVAQIEKAQLSETEIKARGFENLKQLQAAYQLQSLAHYDSQIETIKEREEQESNRKLEQAQAEQLRIEQQQLADVERIRQQFLTKEQVELEAQQRRQLTLDMALESGLLAEQRYQDLSVKNWQNYQKQIAALDAARQSQQLKNAEGLFGDLADVSKAFAGEQSGIYKALFAVSKAFAVAESIIKIQQGIANAAALPFPANIPAMAAVAASTAGIVSTIQSVQMTGMAHDGIDYVPREGTWLLDKGERVLSPRQNSDLTAALKGGGMGGAQMKVVINNNAGVHVGHKQLDDRTMEFILDAVDADQAQRTLNGTGQAAQAGELRYGHNRGNGVGYG